MFEKEYACSTSAEVEKLLGFVEDLKSDCDMPVAQDEIKRLSSELSIVSQNLMGLIDSYASIVNHIDAMIESKFFSLGQVDTLKTIKAMVIELHDTVADD